MRATGAPPVHQEQAHVSTSVWDIPAVLRCFQEAGVKRVHATRVWSYLIRHRGASWSDMPGLPKAAIKLLDNSFARMTSRVIQCQRSSDGSTIKLLVELQGGQQVESVIMAYDTTGRFAACESGSDSTHSSCRTPCNIHAAKQEADNAGPQCSSSDASGPPPLHPIASVAPPAIPAPAAGGLQRGHQRATLCVSSQVGCAMGCTFCATGSMGLKANLSCGEILEQLIHASSLAKVRNIVFMGMGEPLANYSAVRDAVLALTDPELWGLARRHVTISTVGVLPRIRQLHQDMPGVSLALSLHAPSQELRCSLVPSAATWQLGPLMEAVRGYEEASGMRVFMEYVLLAGVNDGEEHADQLGALLASHWPRPLINLIPWNPVDPSGPAAPSYTPTPTTQAPATSGSACTAANHPPPAASPPASTAATGLNSQPTASKGCGCIDGSRAPFPGDCAKQRADDRTCSMGTGIDCVTQPQPDAISGKGRGSAGPPHSHAGEVGTGGEGLGEGSATAAAAGVRRYQAPAPQAIAAFQAVLRSKYGLASTVRQEKGSDIAGACGQLVVQQQQQQQGVGQRRSGRQVGQAKLSTSEGQGDADVVCQAALLVPGPAGELTFGDKVGQRLPCRPSRAAALGAAAVAAARRQAAQEALGLLPAAGLLDLEDLGQPVTVP